jgi:uncharacterized protein (TIGR03086 family)
VQTTTDTLALLSRATSIAQRLVDNVSPDQLGAPTPCAEWDLRALLNHAIGLNHAALTADFPDGDLVGDDPGTAFADSARAAAAAFAAPGALERTVQLPWGEMTGEALAQLLVMDLTIHSWDLAKATGQLDALDPELCAETLARGQAMMRDEYRQPGRGFGPEIAVAADAPICDRMAAFFGREP